MDDTISRQAAIDALKEEEYPCESDYDEGYMAALKKSVWIMEKWLPSAQPERKKGKWEKHYCEDGNPDGWRCDNCDEWYYFGQTLPNFCPNCGSFNGGAE